jgi:hypothetical protein
MHLHGVLFEWNDGTTVEAVDAAFDQMRAFPGKIPGVLNVWAGPNTSESPMGFTYALVVMLESEADLTAYRAHPLHVEAARELPTMIKQRVGLELSAQ